MLSLFPLDCIIELVRGRIRLVIRGLAPRVAGCRYLLNTLDAQLSGK